MTTARYWRRSPGIDAMRQSFEKWRAEYGPEREQGSQKGHGPGPLEESRNQRPEATRVHQSQEVHSAQSSGRRRIGWIQEIRIWTSERDEGEHGQNLRRWRLRRRAFRGHVRQPTDCLRYLQI